MQGEFKCIVNTKTILWYTLFLDCHDWQYWL